MSKRKRYARAAAKCESGPLRDCLTAKTSKEKRSRHYTRGLGKFGAASEVTRLSPDEWGGRKI